MEGVGPTGRVLSPDQLRKLAQFGEERTAAVGEKLFEIGDATYPLIAILEGEAAILDGGGREVVRHGAAGFLGEMNLLSGQTVFLTAVVTEPTRYVAVDREALRQLLGSRIRRANSTISRVASEWRGPRISMPIPWRC